LPHQHHLDSQLYYLIQNKVFHFFIFSSDKASINNSFEVSVHLYVFIFLLNGRFLRDSLGYFTYMSNNGFSSVDYAILSESLLPSVKYSKTNDFTYLSDHAQIELYLKCSITHERF
jgi:hypothetical protein